jgi:O-antigen ligase
VLLSGLAFVILCLKKLIIAICLYLANNVFAESILKDRFIAIVFSLTGNDATTTYTIRQAIMEKSIQTFLTNPIFGVAYYGIGGSTMGWHQEWTDWLAAFGVIGLIFTICVFVKITRRQIFLMKGNIEYIHQYLFSILIFASLGFFNPAINLHTMLTIFLVLPLLRYLHNGTSGRRRKP